MGLVYSKTVTMAEHTFTQVQSLSQHLQRFTETLHFLDQHQQTALNRHCPEGVARKLILGVTAEMC